jgi:hypothetical protein
MTPLRAGIQRHSLAGLALVQHGKQGQGIRVYRTGASVKGSIRVTTSCRLRTNHIRVIGGQPLQFRVRHRKLRKTAIQTDQNLWKHPNSRLSQPFIARKVNINFGGKLPQLERLTPLTAHCHLQKGAFLSAIKIIDLHRSCQRQFLSNISSKRQHHTIQSP